MTFRPAPKNPYRKRKPTRRKRGEFSDKDKAKIIERDNGLCKSCKAPAHHIHHVMPKSSGKGRGLYTNGMLLCHVCHYEVHQFSSKMKYWQHYFAEMYGPDYYKDDWDD